MRRPVQDTEKSLVLIQRHMQCVSHGEKVTKIGQIANNSLTGAKRVTHSP